MLSLFLRHGWVDDEVPYSDDLAFDGKVGLPSGEDLGTADEQALVEPVEWEPRPIADALVRLHGRLPCQVWTTRADGHPQDTSDVIDERTQENRILGTSDQTGLLGEFADHCILDAIPGLHSPARQFEGAEAAPVQQDALLAQQDRSDADADADADADSRVCGWDLGAPGPTGYARRSVGRAPGAGEQLDDGGASAGCDSRSIFSTRKRHSVSRSSHSCSLSSQRIEILGLLNSAARPSPPVISLARGAVRMMKWHGDEP
ncbi:hypothetical protein IQ60_35460 [Streptomyces europaeiscabiei]|nr:hypothetical protein IQ60_35460 [Streptomyces europaeiscabiei]